MDGKEEKVRVPNKAEFKDISFVSENSIELKLKRQ
jgi:hypothetical protein